MSRGDSVRKPERRAQVDPPREPAFINPVRLPQEETVPPRVLVAGPRPELTYLSARLPGEGKSRRLWLSQLTRARWQGRELLLAGPVLGGPQAALLLEKLIVLGARAVMMVGWCGSLTPALPAGSLLIPTRAFPGDGTSPHYLPSGSLPEAHPGLVSLLTERIPALADPLGIPWQMGPVWSTDALYRETPSLVQHCQRQGALALEMELAALLAVAACRGVAAGAVLVVTDELFGEEWRDATRTPEVRRAREQAALLALESLAAWEEG